MTGRDLIGIAKTGSGKTIAFLLPMFRHIMDQRPLEEAEGPICETFLTFTPISIHLERRIELECGSLSSLSLGSGPKYSRAHLHQPSWESPSCNMSGKHILPSVTAVIMTPTRELALQITKECKKFSKSLGLRVVCVYGGTGISEQVNKQPVLLTSPGLSFHDRFCSKSNTVIWVRNWLESCF